MAVIQYSAYTNSKPEHYLDPRDVEDFDSFDLEEIAQEAAEDFYENHDGWEAAWPREIEIFADGLSLGIFEVEREFTPVFSAVIKKDGSHE
ncbi:hypothetical protein [Pantoea dispersa]|uniref:hypothetical protein n=1 Tax=Pantoea dispersa TaxID=59814 RepID=UPI0024AFF819|nr:hypothetical protein [Pantoea dispersa]MDI6637075.1 hypothetical protein [Pantoea dispersa]